MDATEIRTVEELLAVALSHERHAAEAFTATARRMRDAGRPTVAALFDSLAGIERGHVKELETLANSYGVDAGALPTVSSPRHNWADDVLVAGATLYDCLADAVRAEEQAFRFYAYVAANTEDERTRALAERLSLEELGHAADFRRKRRRAYHAHERRPTFWPPVPSALSSTQLMSIAAPREAALHAAFLRNAVHEPVLGTIAETAAARLADLQGRHGTPAPATTDADLPGGHAELALDRAEDRESVMRAALSDASGAFGFYDAVVDRTGDDDATLDLAQALAEMSIDRLRAVSDLQDAPHTGLT
jgi:rubrerythrin